MKNDSTIDKLLSLNIAKFRDALVQNKDLSYELYYKNNHHSNDILYPRYYKYKGQITFYSTYHWSQHNQKIDKITSNTKLIIIDSKYEHYLSIYYYNVIGKADIGKIPVCNLTKHYIKHIKYNDVLVRFRYNLYNYCEAVLYILKARTHKRSLFSLLPLEIIKMVLWYKSFLI